MAEQISPHNVHDSTTPLLRRKELCKLRVVKKKKRGVKEKVEAEGWMNTEELHVKWSIKPPLAVLGPLRDGEGQSKNAVSGKEGAADRQLPPGQKKERRHGGLNRKLKAPEEPGAASSTSGSASGSAPSTGCFSHEHLKGKTSEGKSIPPPQKS